MKLRVNSGALTALGLGSALLSSCSIGEQQRPNVLLIMTDDQGWGDFGFNGNRDIHTPNLDSLESEAVHLTHFYTSPLSAPTRAGLLTGRNHLRTGTLSVTRAAENMDNREVTLAEVLRDNGYRTGCFGKWHNGAHYPQNAMGQGFDTFLGFSAGHLTNYFDSELESGDSTIKSSGYITDVLTDGAIDFMESSSSQPFLCYVPYNAPHAPYQVPDSYFNRYKHLMRESSDMTTAVYGMCENVDYNIGRLLKYLESSGKIDNTVVIFLSDNGLNNPRYNGVHRGRKGQLYEGGVRVPCLIYYKGKLTASKIDANTSHIDLMPTILSMVNIDYTSERNFDGVDLSPILEHSNHELREALDSRAIFTHRSSSESKLSEAGTLLIQGNYKLLNIGGNYELYDIESDPSERNNLAKSNPALLDSLRTLSHNWFKEVEAEFNTNQRRQTRIGLHPSTSTLPAHEAYITGGVHYFTNEHGWAGDYLTSIYPSDTIGWQVSVERGGRYRVSLHYGLRSGSQRPLTAIESTTSKSRSQEVELEYYNPTAIDSPDRVKRVEAYEQSWAVAPLGKIELTEGQDMLRVILSGKDGTAIEGLEIKAIDITPIEN